MNIIARHRVQKVDAAIRFQEYGVGIFVQINTKSALKKAIKRQQILINQKPATTAHFVQQGDVIELLEIPQQPTKPYMLDLKVLYEDDYLAVILKPAGISVSGNKLATIANALSQNLKSSSQLDATNPHPVHRLDYATSGLLVIGKTLNSRQLLHQMFENHQVKKTYHAVCVRHFEHTEEWIAEPLDGKDAKTYYRVIRSEKSERFESLNLVELTPETGRTHQLRKHMLYIGHPIMGDQKYFLEGLQHQGYGLYLFASKLVFNHPITQEKLAIQTDLPAKFKRIFNLT